MSEGKVGLEAYPFHCPPVSPISFFIPVLSFPIHLFPVYHLVLKTRDFLWSREGKERPKGHRKERVPSLSLVHFLILSSLDNERENEGKRENRKDRKERKWPSLFTFSSSPIREKKRSIQKKREKNSKKKGNKEEEKEIDS